MSENSQTARDPGTAVLGNFSITLPTPNGGQLSMSGYAYAGESKESLDERMDIFRQSLERQQRFFEIPALQAKIEQYKKALVDVTAAYQDLLERQKAGRGGSKPLASQEQANLKTYPLQIKGIEAELAKGRKALAEAQAGI
jgi:hypothetical protein